jgi:reverse gyrase
MMLAIEQLIATIERLFYPACPNCGGGYGADRLKESSPNATPLRASESAL